MLAIQVNEFGGPEVLTPREVPDPEPGPGQVLVDVAAADVIFLDTRIRAGEAQQWFPTRPPYVPGGAVTGTVNSQPVAARVRGSYAEKALADDVISIPDGLSPLDAAALLHDGPTALGLFDDAEIKPGDRVLITGAAGGMGLLLVQLAVDAGAHFTGAVSAHKADVVRRLGAEPTGYDGMRGEFDVVLDGVGGEAGARAFELVRNGGRFSAHGAASGQFVRLPETSDVRVTGIERVQFGPEELREKTERAFREAVTKRFFPIIGQAYPLHQAAAAHARIEARQAVGKTLLRV